VAGSGVLLLAFILLCGAAAIGGGLAVLYLRARPAPTAVLAAHATLGIASVVALRIALRRGLPHIGMGTGGFGQAATVLLALALAFGLRLAWLGWHGRRPTELLVGTHALCAIIGLVLVLSLVALG
jgi:hypothetical protein